MLKTSFIFILLLLNLYSISRSINGNKSYFIENKKQLTDQYNKTRNDIKFYYNSNGKTVYFHNKGISYQLTKANNSKKNLTSYRVDIEYIGSNDNLN